jgi:putative addiction module component (TIGR02574 family)
MTETTRDLLKRVLELPPAERAELLLELEASLDDGDDPGEADPEFSAELERRIRDVEEGRVQPVPLDDVLAEARAQLRRRSEGSGSG